MLQNGSIGTPKTRIMLHGVPMDVSEDNLGASFSHYGLVINKAGTETGKFILQITVTRKNFLDIPIH